MLKLVQGILEFRKLHLSDYRNRFSHLAMGQKPDSLFITCSDSRVVPNLFTSTHPGHLFVLRNAGNIVPPYHVLCSERASIEFAVSQLPIENIIVCGHSNCGAMHAIMGGQKLSLKVCNFGFLTEKTQKNVLPLKVWLKKISSSRSNISKLSPL